MTDFLIGADPEFFLKRDGKPFSAHGMIDGDKKNPLPVDGGAVQIDGTAVEFNIDPSENEEQFLSNLDKVLGQLREMIPPDYEFAFEGGVTYERDVWSEIPEDAKELGCEPEYEALTGEYHLLDKRHEESNVRHGAGHIHIGGYTYADDPHEPMHFFECRKVAHVANFFLGMPLTLLEGETLRRDGYGGVGTFRPKSYGLEYRTPSNFWLRHEETRKLVYRETKNMMNYLLSEEHRYTDFGDMFENYMMRQIFRDSRRGNVCRGRYNIDLFMRRGLRFCTEETKDMVRDELKDLGLK